MKRISLKKVHDFLCTHPELLKTPIPKVITVPAGQGFAVFGRCITTCCVLATKSSTPNTRWQDFESGTPICPECGRDLPFSHWEIELNPAPTPTPRSA